MGKALKLLIMGIVFLFILSAMGRCLGGCLCGRGGGSWGGSSRGMSSGWGK